MSTFIRLYERWNRLWNHANGRAHLAAIKFPDYVFPWKTAKFLVTSVSPWIISAFLLICISIFLFFLRKNIPTSLKGKKLVHCHVLENRRLRLDSFLSSKWDSIKWKDTTNTQKNISKLSWRCYVSKRTYIDNWLYTYILIHI